ncbi:DUF4105 domain-containing protein [Luteimonas sp. SJ-16]|uniref:DUF4105 domain-containing protein n=2 Tax=Luteimonas deserti TaxID=2752306 RepID=A0A7Z0QS56_9GAMM|nr:DUF4105 domain-containing protein [Luteimonas deserti]
MLVRVIVVLLACAAGSDAGASWRWQFDAEGRAPLDAAQQAASAQIFETAFATLPPAWRAADGLDVRVQWRDDLRDGVHGHARGDRVLLRRALLDAWIAAGPEAATASPPRRAALAAVVHELAHRYDRSPHGGLSRDGRLRDLAGWPVRPLRFGLRTRDNAMSDRSPDRYELTSPAEFVAVNLEHFLLDPEYACRRPALHAYFAAHFAWAPDAAACDPVLPFVEAESVDDTEAASSPLPGLDPARVYAVDYLLAEGNARPMSRWGHSMLRLVVCAPGRAPGPDCRYDLTHHRVLSFRAFVDDVQISSLRGLTGRYPSRLFELPLDQVVEEYTKLELRGLQSIPLGLSPDEIAALLNHAATLHWSYDGRYYFVGNNCAVETWKLLQTGVPRLADARLRSITPNGLLRNLVRSGAADPSVLDREDAVHAGFHFPSADAEYQALLDIARNAQPLPAVRAEDWLDLAPDVRAPWLATAELRDAAALLVLEQAARRREELRLRDVLKRHLLDARQTADAAPAVAALRALLAAGDGFSRPARLLDAGYGLPHAAERVVLRHEVRAGAVRLRGLRGRLEELARSALSPDAQARIASLDQNLETLGSRLRDLHRAAGGLQLE